MRGVVRGAAVVWLGLGAGLAPVASGCAYAPTPEDTPSLEAGGGAALEAGSSETETDSQGRAPADAGGGAPEGNDASMAGPPADAALDVLLPGTASGVDASEEGPAEIDASDGGAGSDSGSDMDSFPGDTGHPSSHDAGPSLDATGSDVADVAEAAVASDASGPADSPNEAATPPVGFVQIATATVIGTNSATVSVAFGHPQTRGNLLVVGVAWRDTTTGITAVSDTAHDAFVPVGDVTRMGASLSQAIYYASNVSADPGNKITVSFDMAPKAPDLRAMEYSGVSALDVSAVGYNVSNAATCGPTPAPLPPPEMLVAIGVATGVYSGPPTGFTLRTSSHNPEGNLVADMTAQKPGPYSAAASLTSTSEWILELVTFH